MHIADVTKKTPGLVGSGKREKGVVKQERDESHSREEKKSKGSVKPKFTSKKTNFFFFFEFPFPLPPPHDARQPRRDIVVAREQQQQQQRLQSAAATAAAAPASALREAAEPIAASRSSNSVLFFSFIFIAPRVTPRCFHERPLAACGLA